MAIRVSPLMGLGAIAQGYEQQRQKDQQIRNQQLIEQAYLRSIAAQKQEEEAGKLAFGSLLKGGGDLSGLAGLGDQPPPPGSMPQSQYTAAPTGSGMASGLPDMTYGFPSIPGSLPKLAANPQNTGGMTNALPTGQFDPANPRATDPGYAPKMVPGGGAQLASAGGDDSGTADAAYIAQQARIRNLNPSEWLRVGATEGGLDGRFRLGDGGKSGGPFQFYTGGGLGNEFQKDTRKDPLSPSSARAEVRYGMDKAIERSGGHPDPNVYHGLRGQPGVASTGYLREIPQQVQQTAGQVAGSIDPVVYGRMSLQALAQRVEKANPGADPLVKMMAVERLNKLLAPGERQQWQYYMLQNRQEFQNQLEIMRENFREQMATQAQTAAAGRSEGAGWGFMTGPDGTIYRTNSRTGEVAPADVPAGTTRTGTLSSGGAGGKLPTSKNIAVIDDKGNEVFHGSAHQSKGGWISDADQELIKVPKGGKIDILGAETTGGGRAGAQVLRQTIGAREVLSDLQNAVSMPVGETTGFLGGYHPGTDLMGTVGGNLARTLTGQDAQLMQASFASLSRELSILMSPVYGGNWAAQQIDPLIPKEGNSVGTTLFKIARIAQSADNALEEISKSPILSGEQKRSAIEMREAIRQAVPWTASQAMQFARGGNEDVSFKEFMESHGGTKAPSMGGGGTKSGAAHYVGEIIEQGGKRYRVTGGDMNDPDVEEVTK